METVEAETKEAVSPSANENVEPMSAPPLGAYILRKFNISAAQDSSFGSDVLDTDHILNFGDEAHSQTVFVRLFDSESSRGVVFKRAALTLTVKNMGIEGLRLCDCVLNEGVENLMYVGKHLRLPGTDIGYKLGIVTSEGISFTSKKDPELLRLDATRDELTVLKGKIDANLALLRSLSHEFVQLQLIGAENKGVLLQKLSELKALMSADDVLREEFEAKHVLFQEKVKRLQVLLNGAEEDDSLCCPICKQMYFKPVVPSCGHAACSECIFRWMYMSIKTTCPLCREEIVTLTIDEELESRVQEMASKFGPVQFADRALQQATHRYWHWLRVNNQWSLLSPEIAALYESAQNEGEGNR